MAAFLAIVCMCICAYMHISHIYVCTIFSRGCYWKFLQDTEVVETSLIDLTNVSKIHFIPCEHILYKPYVCTRFISLRLEWYFGVIHRYTNYYVCTYVIQIKIIVKYHEILKFVGLK